MEGAMPSSTGSTQRPDGEGAGGMPFSQQNVLLTKQELVQLRWEAHYWKSQHDRVIAREAALKHELEQARAKIRDLQQRLYGKRSEQRAAPPEGRSKSGVAARARGQVPGARGHGRTPRPDLAVVEELRTLGAAEQVCSQCGAPFQVVAGTEDSQLFEIQVQAYTRRIKRQRYRKSCRCASTPGLITAPVAPRVIPKSPLGVSVWTEVLLDKYLYARPTNRLCQDLSALGLALAPGTLAGGLQQLRPLFAPVLQAMREKQLSERLFHGDETRWQVFEAIDGKVGYRWYLWVTQSASVVYYRMAPGRGAAVPKGHFAGLSHEDPIILVCDRYSAYKRLAKDCPTIVLAFCWAHVRRDFLDGAKQWSTLNAWMLSWVEAIGELYRLNDQRLAMWEEDLPLAAQSPVFHRRHQALVDRLAHLAARRDQQLTEATLHRAQTKVLNSLRTHWSGLTVFVDHPQVPMDNNQAERSLRNPVNGRKNYYGSGAVWSAELAAMLFTILQTIILWGLNPRHWLHAFLSACADHGGQPLTDLAPFLPWTMAEARRDQLTRPRPGAGFPPLGTAPPAPLDTS